MKICAIAMLLCLLTIVSARIEDFGEEDLQFLTVAKALKGWDYIIGANPENETDCTAFTKSEYKQIVCEKGIDGKYRINSIRVYTDNKQEHQVDQIPEEIGNLTKLRTFKMDSQLDVKALPASIVNCPSLTHLVFETGLLKATPVFPENSQILWLSFINNPSIVISPTIFALKKLIYLGLAQTRLSSIDIPDNCLISTYELSNNNFVEFPKSLLRQTNATIINLANNQIATLGDIPATFACQQLLMHNNKIESISKTVFAIQKLEKLILSYNILKTLPELDVQPLTLSTLSFAGNKLTSLPISITKIPTLKELDVKFNPCLNFNIADVSTNVTMLGCLDTCTNDVATEGKCDFSSECKDANCYSCELFKSNTLCSAASSGCIWSGTTCYDKKAVSCEKLITKQDCHEFLIPPYYSSNCVWDGVGKCLNKTTAACSEFLTSSACNTLYVECKFINGKCYQKDDNSMLVDPKFTDYALTITIVSIVVVIVICAAIFVVYKKFVKKTQHQYTPLAI